MTKTIIYHNPRCSKSRQALAILQEHLTNPQVIEYLKTPPTAKELATLLAQMSMTPRDLLRKGEPLYRDLGLAKSTLTDKEIIAIMVENPILIERPIVIVNNKAIVARPPEKVLELL